MLNWARWNVEDVKLESNYDPHRMLFPEVTVQLRLEYDSYSTPPHCNCALLMDDLRERLGTQPKIQTSTLYGHMARHTVIDEFANCFEKYKYPTIKKVIFNDPATIIMWNDGSKTVVKCQNGEPFDPEKGFVMAYLKKLLGNANTFNKEIAKWVKYDEPKKTKPDIEEKSVNWFSKKPQEITFTIKADQISFDELF